MEQLPYRAEYRRKLPHFQPENTPLFVTFRLFGSIPQLVIKQLESERNRFLKQLECFDKDDRSKATLQFERSRFVLIEKTLDHSRSEPLWLSDDRIAQVLTESLKYRNGKDYVLDAYCVMANHVHAVFTPLKTLGENEPVSLAKIMKSLKGFTARQCNSILKRNGTFWEAESYDHYVRSEAEWMRIIRYVLNNPVKAGLVQNWTEWKWSYCKFGKES